ncbi:MAG: alpha-L-rhamnosidase N-terminal domain-containing protein [Clostridiales bacterium]|nr:alpha-L-rhamnosidase N-terminal domain-containing protein [Clostridiales bacterium]
MRNWIWVKDGSPSENAVACFRKQFICETNVKTMVSISADTRYILYINGHEVGQGPIRSTKERWFYDEYDITPYLDGDYNIIAISVWDYGMSTYQSITNQGGTIFSIKQGELLICQSDDSVKSSINTGIKSKTVKRNVNLGFMEYFNANKFDSMWMKKSFDDSSWNNSANIKDNWGKLHSREVKFMDHQIVRPQNIYSIKEVIPTIKNISVNLRPTMFPNRKDANASIFSGFLGFYITSTKNQKGYINFPNNKWNGVFGDLKIDETYYNIDNINRKTAINLKKGKQLLLMNIAAKHDDLYSHMEFSFDEELIYSDFFTIGPTSYIENKTDGFNKIYGGLENYNQILNITDKHKEIYECSPDLSSVMELIKPISNEYVFFDEYILSLVENKRVIKERVVLSEDNGLLHGNTLPTILQPTTNGADLEVLVDFYDMFVGNIGFSIKSEANTVLDIYGFENLFEDKIDYTFGLNNGIRYITKDGYQQYSASTRLGFRYLMLTFRNLTSPIEIYSLTVNQRSHPVGRSGHFRCDDYLLNKIYDISRRTNQLCSEDTFTDSPTYEQAFWSGDAQVSSMVSAYYFGEKYLVKNCIMQVPLSRKNTKLLAALMPTDWETAIPLWTMNWIITIDEYIFNTGDDSVIEELYEPVKETLKYYTKFIEKDGAFNISAWNMVDWAPMDIYNQGVMTAQQGLLTHCFDIFLKMAKRLNKEENLFTEYKERLLTYLDTKLWLEDDKEFADGYTVEHGLSKTVGMQTHVMLFKYDLIKDNVKKEIVLKKILDKPKHWLDVGSPFMLFYLFDIYNKQGENQRILNEIRNIWGMMLRYDSSTCWEVFPGFYENSRTRSYCHSWSSSPGYVFIKYLLGFSPIEEGFNKILLKIPDVDIKWCEGSIPTPHGRIDVRWSRENNQQVFHAKVPKTIEIVTQINDNWNITIERI